MEKSEQSQGPPPFLGPTGVAANHTDKRSYGIGNVFRQRWGWFVTGGVLIWGGVLLFSAVLVYVMPREFLGRVRMEIHPNSHRFEVFPENSGISNYDRDSFMATQRMILTSKETIYKVVDEMQLVKKWEDAKTRSDAWKMLKEKITVTGHPGTRLVDIEVLHTDPQGAAELANAIARAYRERRNSIENSRASASLDMLNAQEALQAQKVEDARLKMIELMEKFNIVDLGLPTPDWPDLNGDSPITGTRNLVLEARLATQKARIETAKFQTLASKLTSSKGEVMLASLLAGDSDLLPDRVRKQMDHYDVLRAREAVLAAQGVSDTAPEMVAVKAEIDFYRRELDLSVARIRSGIQSRLETAAKSLENIEGIERVIEDESMDERKRYTQYMDAKRNYHTQNRILARMTDELLKEKVDLTMPKDPISIHEIAEANERPASPDVGARLWSGFRLGFVLSIPGGLCLMYLGYASSSRSEENQDEYEYEEEDELEEAIEVAESDLDESNTW